MHNLNININLQVELVSVDVPIPPQVLEECFHHHQDPIKPHPEGVRCVLLLDNR